MHTLIGDVHQVLIGRTQYIDRFLADLHVGHELQFVEVHLGDTAGPLAARHQVVTIARERHVVDAWPGHADALNELPGFGIAEVEAFIALGHDDGFAAVRREVEIA